MNIRKLVIAILCLNLCYCSGMSDRLDRVGKAPDFQNVNTYEGEILDNYYHNGITDPIEALEQKPAPTRTANSLWRPGAREFFRDQRARSVGDILKVVVTIKDQAKMDNKTSSSRKDTGNLLVYLTSLA